MKSFMLLSLLAVNSVSAQERGVELSKKEVVLNVDISTARVRLSAADYSFPVVKVLVPDLADVTILNHRNTGEGAPCLATYETMSPEKVIQDRPAIEQIPFTITLTKYAYIDFEGTCNVSLQETVKGTIRGFEFTHDRSLDVGKRHIDDCR